MTLWTALVHPCCYRNSFRFRSRLPAVVSVLVCVDASGSESIHFLLTPNGAFIDEKMAVVCLSGTSEFMEVYTGLYIRMGFRLSRHFRAKWNKRNHKIGIQSSQRNQAESARFSSCHVRASDVVRVWPGFRTWCNVICGRRRSPGRGHRRGGQSPRRCSVHQKIYFRANCSILGSRASRISPNVLRLATLVAGFIALKLLVTL